MADKIGLNRSTVSGYENEGKMPSYNTLEEISKVLNCSIGFNTSQVFIQKKLPPIYTRHITFKKPAIK